MSIFFFENAKYSTKTFIKLNYVALYKITHIASHTGTFYLLRISSPPYDTFDQPFPYKCSYSCLIITDVPNNIYTTISLQNKTKSQTTEGLFSRFCLVAIFWTLTGRPRGQSVGAP